MADSVLPRQQVIAALNAQQLTFLAVNTSKDTLGKNGLPDVKWYKEALDETAGIEKCASIMDLHDKKCKLLGNPEPMDADTLWLLIISENLTVGEITDDNVDAFIEGYRELENELKPKMYTYIILSNEDGDE